MFLKKSPRDLRGRQRDEAAVRADLDAYLVSERLASTVSKTWVGLRNPFQGLRMAEESG